VIAPMVLRTMRADPAEAKTGTLPSDQSLHSIAMSVRNV
jgi:hypothetical protein